MGSVTELKRSDLVHPELSYAIVGALFDVYNTLGHGHLEKTYQRAVAQSLKDRKLSFREQVPVPVTYRGTAVARQFLDFLIEDAVSRTKTR
ncbi:GxxExxY protein [Patescibacteria group bacterium]|nr:MAG: GxxExxY protein [Patescibacteria group bacterium]